MTLALTALVIGAVLQTPKALETSNDSPMVRSASLAPLILESSPTNYLVHLAWVNPPHQDIANVRIYHGTNSGTYYEYKDVGVVTNYSYVVSDDHPWDYFVATVFDPLGNESVLSNEAPPLPNTHIRLTWTGVAMNLSNSTVWPPVWRFLTNSSSPVMLPATGRQMWFLGTNLTATGFNPLNK